MRRRRWQPVAGALIVTAALAVPMVNGVTAMERTKAGSPARTAPDAVSWPSHCLDEVPNSPDDYQQVFDHRSSGWAGADGGWPIALPDDRVLWLFGDTFMGEIDENNALRPGWRMVRSVQVQDGKCFTPMTRGTMEKPTSFFPDQDGMVFWPSGGYVDTSVDPAVVRVVSTGICPEPGGWRVCNMKIHTLSLPDLDVVSVDSVPYDPNALDMPQFGGKIFHDGDYVYLYGKAGGFQHGGPSDGGPFAPGLYVARVPPGQLTSGGWEYATGDGAWAQDVNSAKPVEIDDPADPRALANAGVVRWGDGYLMTGKRGAAWVYGPQLYAWTSDSPTGPWSIVRQNGDPVDLAPDVEFPQSRLFYGGQLVTSVPGTSATEPMMVFSTNGVGCDKSDNDPPCTPDTDVEKNVLLYGPHALVPKGLPSPSTR